MAYHQNFLDMHLHSVKAIRYSPFMSEEIPFLSM